MESSCRLPSVAARRRRGYKAEFRGIATLAAFPDAGGDRDVAPGGSPGLDALDRALRLDPQAHVEQDAPGSTAHRVEVGPRPAPRTRSPRSSARAGSSGHFLETQREAQDQLGQRLTIQVRVVQLSGHPLAGFDQLIGLDVGVRREAKRSRPAEGGLASAAPDADQGAELGILESCWAARASAAARDSGTRNSAQRIPFVPAAARRSGRRTPQPAWTDGRAMFGDGAC